MVISILGGRMEALIYSCLVAAATALESLAALKHSPMLVSDLPSKGSVRGSLLRCSDVKMAVQVESDTESTDSKRWAETMLVERWSWLLHDSLLR
jgi:hypothetical protein